MPGAGGRRSSTWPKGQKPPVQKPKGAKSKKTILKEKLGIQNWQQLHAWIEGPGIEQCIKEMKKMKGRNYVSAYTQLTEFVKPKLARTELKAEAEMNVHLSDQPIVFE